MSTEGDYLRKHVGSGGFRAGCESGKLTFVRKSDAKLALRRLQSFGLNDARRCYRCPKCGFFHLTSHV